MAEVLIIANWFVCITIARYDGGYSKIAMVSLFFVLGGLPNPKSRQRRRISPAKYGATPNDREFAEFDSI